MLFLMTIYKVFYKLSLRCLFLYFTSNHRGIEIEAELQIANLFQKH